MISSVMEDDEAEYLKSLEVMNKLFQKHSIEADLESST
jgi:hypothetical protein